MIGTENQTHTDVDQFITGQETALHRVLDSLLDRLDEFPRNRAAGDLVLENKTFTRSRLDLELDVAELAAAAGLLFEDFFAGRRLRDCLAIGDLGFADIRLNAKLAFHAVDDDLKM